MGSVAAKASQQVNKLFPNPNSFSYKWVDHTYIDIMKDSELMKCVVRECAWKSSHNSVVGDVQILGPASINIFTSVLNAGCRVVELDIFESNKELGKPVVAHGNLEANLQVTPAVDLELVCEVIRDYAWRNTNEPLIVFMEMNIEWNNRVVQENIVQTFQYYLKDRLYLSSVPFADLPLSLLAGKLIVIPSTRMTGLQPILYTSLYGSRQFHNRASNQDPFESKSELVRVYAANVIVSNNFDPRPFLAVKNQFICMNWTYKDRHLTVMSSYFKGKGVRPF